jgi:hypothetical protein
LKIESSNWDDGIIVWQACRMTRVHEAEKVVDLIRPTTLAAYELGFKEYISSAAHISVKKYSSMLPAVG